MSVSVHAQRAESFTQSIGVNTHIGWTGTVFDNVSQVEQELTFLAVDHVRDQQPYPTDLTSYQALASTGVKFDLFIGGPGDDFGSVLPTLLPYIDLLEQSNPGSILSLEGPNEPNGTMPVYYNGVSSDTNGSVADQVMRAIHSAVSADGNLASIPVLNASLGGSTWQSYAEQEGNMSAYVEGANYHVYPTDGEQPNNSLPFAAQMAEMTAPGLPLTFTEAGYSTALQDGGVDQATQAKNTLNMLADAYKLGAQQTYLYELSDGLANPSATDAENSFGLFTASGAPKQAATDIHNLTSILSDTGSNAQSFATGSLSYSISNLPSAGNSLLLEKSSGAFNLMLWNEAADWNATTETEIAVGPTMTTVNLGTKAGTVEIFDPTVGTAPIETLNNTSQVTVSLTDHPLIVEIEPTSATPTPTLTPTPNDTVVAAGSPGSITDASGNLWTITSGGQVAVNGTADTTTANVIEIAYVNGTIWQENSSDLWWGKTQPTESWSPATGTATSPLPAASTPSANGTMITSASVSSIIDRSGNAWTLVQSASEGLQIAVNGQVDAVTSNVVLLETLNGKMVQENASGNWYSEPGANGPWSQIPAPTIDVTVSKTGKASTLAGATVGTTQLDGATFVLTAPGVAKVTLGATADKLQFLGMSSVSVTGGSAAATVTADGGLDTFTGGWGKLTITGGVSGDSYVYHKGDGLMTIENFSLSKGDTLTVDAALKGAMQQKADGHGGIVVSFGTGSSGVDLVGVTSIASSQIHFT